MDSTVSTVKIRGNDSVVSSSLLQNLDFSSGSSDQRAIVVGSVPHRGIRKSAGTTAASANGPLLQGRVLELLNLEERKLVFGSGDGDNGGVGWPNLEGRMSEMLWRGRALSRLASCTLRRWAQRDRLRGW